MPKCEVRWIDIHTGKTTEDNNDAVAIAQPWYRHYSEPLCDEAKKNANDSLEPFRCGHPLKLDPRGGHYICKEHEAMMRRTRNWDIIPIDTWAL